MHGFLLFSGSDSNPSELLAIGISLTASLTLVSMASLKRPKWYFSLLMDGLMIFHPLVFMFMRMW
jgi:hypothetical protein